MPWDFERLEVYQKAMGLVDDIYKLTRSFPVEERFGLADQFRRAAISVALNIAEGSGRTKRDFRNFLRNARSSCYECVAVLQISGRLAYLSRDAQQRCGEHLVDVAKMISGLMRAVGGDHHEHGAPNHEG